MDEKRCKERVVPNERWGAFHAHQCSRKIWKDGFCKQHHPETEKQRDARAREQWNAKNENSDRMKLKRAYERIKELEAEVERLRLCPPIIK